MRPRNQTQVSLLKTAGDAPESAPRAPSNFAKWTYFTAFPFLSFKLPIPTQPDVNPNLGHSPLWSPAEAKLLGLKGLIL